MKIKYDKEADAVYIELKESKFSHNKKLDKNTIMDYDKENNIIGIEILFVKENNPSILEYLKEKKIIL